MVINSLHTLLHTVHQDKDGADINSFVDQNEEPNRSKKNYQGCLGLKVSQHTNDQFSIHLHLAAHKPLESRN